MPHEPTGQAICSSAEICRRNGWTVGTRLVADFERPGRGITSRHQIEITAIGYCAVVAMLVTVDGISVYGIYDEVMWDLRCRDWEAV